MSDPVGARVAFLRSVVFAIAFLVLASWALSFAHRLYWLNPGGVVGLALAIAFARRWAGSTAALLRGLAEPLAFWPFLLLSALALIAALAYPVTMLDSLSYRLPRILLWLQADTIHHIASSNPRMNYMPPVWELASMPFVQWTGARFVCFWNCVSWVVLFLVAYDWAFELTGEVRKSRQMAFLGSTSVFAVLQAGSTANDLFATALALCSLRFILIFERTRDWREIGWAVLSFCLASGTKPQFCVLGLPLVCWFVFSSSKPWKIFRWPWAPALLPLWIICSPIPSFVMSYQHYGSWAGPGGTRRETPGQQVEPSPVWNVAVGMPLLFWQAIQPPVNPLAFVLNERLDQAVQKSGIREHVQRFTLRMAPFSMVDSASLGLVTALLFAGGIVLALRTDRALLKSWRGWAMTTALVSLVIGVSQFVAETSGRAYCGFLYLLLPLAMAGWSLVRPQRLRLFVYVCLFSSMLVLILNPARPLWPVRRVHAALAASPHFARLAGGMKPYLLFPERAHAGESIVQTIPANERRVVVLIGDDRPLLPLFYPYSLGRQLILLPPHSNPEALQEVAVNYVIAGAGAEEVYPQICDYLESGDDYTLVLSDDYVSKLARGPETWKLYQKKPRGGTEVPAP